MNAFDATILGFINQFAHRWWLVDATLYNLAFNALFKGCVLLGLLFWAWFAPSKDQERNRRIVIATIAGAVLAVLLGRLLAYYLPFRVRPIHNPDFHFVLPYAMSREDLRGWSAFPSDSAMYGFAVVTGLFLVSRWLGLIALLHTLFFIVFLRMYVGYHHPTDLIGGAVIGVALTLLVNRPALRDRLAAPLLHWEHAYRAAFYACFGIVMFQFGDSWEAASKLTSQLVHAVKLASSKGSQQSALRSASAAPRTAEAGSPDECGVRPPAQGREAVEVKVEVARRPGSRSLPIELLEDGKVVRLGAVHPGVVRQPNP